MREWEDSDVLFEAFMQAWARALARLEADVSDQSAQLVADCLGNISIKVQTHNLTKRMNSRHNKPCTCEICKLLSNQYPGE